MPLQPRKPCLVTFEEVLNDILYFNVVFPYSNFSVFARNLDAYLRTKLGEVSWKRRDDLDPGLFREVSLMRCCVST